MIQLSNAFLYLKIYFQILYTKDMVRVSELEDIKKQQQKLTRMLELHYQPG